MASSEFEMTLSWPGIEQIAEIIAHLKRRNDELERALTAVQEISSQQVEEIRRLKRGGLGQVGEQGGAEQE